MNTITTQLDSAVSWLNQGKVLIFPTETVYGLGVDAQNPEAIRQLFTLKKRPLSKPVPVLLPNKKEISKYCKKITKTAQALINAFWPGPLTLVMESDQFPKGVSDNGKVGFRVSANPLAQNLLLKFGRCITATSANVSNKAVPDDALEFFRIFPKDSFLLIQEIKPGKSSKPSTVVDCTGENYKILREGAISRSEIDVILSEKH